MHLKPFCWSPGPAGELTGLTENGYKRNERKDEGKAGNERKWKHDSEKGQVPALLFPTVYIIACYARVLDVGRLYLHDVYY